MAKTRTNAGRRGQFSFAFNAQTRINRSVFAFPQNVKTTFNAGFINPVCHWEVLPGDTMSVHLSQLSRMWTCLVPFMDNVTMDIFYWYVPNRLVWDNWEKFCGDKTTVDGALATDYIIPTVQGTLGHDFENSIYDLYGLPVVFGNGSTVAKYGTDDLPINALVLRGYNLIYNEWYRPEFIIEPVTVHTDDGPDPIADYQLLRRAKRLDYFTGCNPWPQYGPAVSVPLTGEAPVVLSSSSNITLPTGSIGTSEGLISGFVGHPSGSYDNYTTDNVTGSSTGFLPITVNGLTGFSADMSNVSAITVNEWRQVFAIQRFYERLARGGARYTEVIRSFFGVDVGDARLQRPEYLGGGSVHLYVNPVSQNGATSSDSPLGTLAAYAVASGRSGGFNRSFVEHGFVHCLISVRSDYTYQQGIDRSWSRQLWTDYYWPPFAHLGEQAVLNKELFVQGTAADNEVFGYQERYAEYRYAQSRICGQFRSTCEQPLDMWHLAQDFDNLPTLSADFINENPPIDRVIATDSSRKNTPQFFGDFMFNIRWTRPIPTYGTPGLIDHF